MRAEIIDIAGLTARQWGAWSDLAERACVANPFNEPDFVKSAVRGLDERRVGVLAVTDRHGWRAAMPVLRVARWRRVPGRLLVAWRHRYCYLTTPLVDRDDPEAALATLFARGAAEPGTLGLMLDWIDTDGPVGAALEAGVLRARRPLRIEGFARATLERRPSNDYVAQMVSTKRRRELRRLRSRFEDEVGPLMLYDRAGEGDAVAGFLELERSGWKARAGTAMANSSSHARFFVELCERYAATSRMQLLTLETESATVAMKCNLVAGEGIFCFKIAFDERFARFSPGIQLELANIDVFHDRKSATWMDSCAAADNAMINRLWSDRRTLQSVLIAPHGPRGALGSMLWRTARSAHTAIVDR
ncbi:MAG: GNAT family N-acetyltransferase [Solirubrobacteraceae bacterium]